MKQQEIQSQKRLILFLFILSLLSLMACFFFLEFWYAQKDGLQNGFHIFNTSYSVFYWFSHVSYLSCLFVTIWSGFELLGFYNEKYKPKFIFRFFTLFWITLTMCGEGLLLPSMMAPRVEVILDIFEFSNWSNASWWFGIGGFFYSLIDFLQFMSIHIAMPVTMIVYSIKYKQEELSTNDKWIGVGMVSGFMLGWYIYCGVFTLLGMPGPYPIADWTPDGNNDWTLVVQILLSLMGFVVFTLITFYTLGDLEKKWNSADVKEANVEYSSQTNES